MVQTEIIKEVKQKEVLSVTADETKGLQKDFSSLNLYK